ncbi:endospore germination permease [Clostridium sediminicola]|uniref:GerAB/ArcD/ProY family transporter n=1 Tax=Clostridium sediminicola TaxID=3114879 RepID=UPI0031F271BC
MQNSNLTYKQAIILIILFISGSSTILTPGIEAKKDVWLAILLAMIFALPILLIFERFLYLFPDKDLFDILQIIFGKVLGKFFSILYIWFSFHLGTLVICNFAYFIDIVSLDNTPLIILTLFIAIICIEAVTFGIEIIGRWGEFAVVFLIISISIPVILLIKDMNINNLMPILYDGFTPVLKGAFSVFSFPFAELVIFTMVFTSFKEKESPKIYRIGLFLGGILLLITSLSDILILGADIAEIDYFPAYTTVRRIKLGTFIERIEILISMMFLIGGITKISICLLAASKGVTKLFGFKEYRFIVTPIGITMSILSTFIYKSIMEMSTWALKVWPYYAFIFQAILPVIFFIAAEIYVRFKKA